MSESSFFVLIVVGTEAASNIDYREGTRGKRVGPPTNLAVKLFALALLNKYGHISGVWASFLLLGGTFRLSPVLSLHGPIVLYWGA
jgi:hypothetical protein